jgi:hypothetical protein
MKRSGEKWKRTAFSELFEFFGLKNGNLKAWQQFPKALYLIKFILIIIIIFEFNSIALIVTTTEYGRIVRYGRDRYLRGLLGIHSYLSLEVVGVPISKRYSSQPMREAKTRRRWAIQSSRGTVRTWTLSRAQTHPTIVSMCQRHQHPKASGNETTMIPSIKRKGCRWC